MALVIGTDVGLFRARSVPFDESDLEAVLDCGPVPDLRLDPTRSDLFAATATGLFRSSDGGRHWEDLGLPVPEGPWSVWSVAPTEEGVVYAGTDEPCLYRSTDAGASWERRTDFTDLPSRSIWLGPGDHAGARLRGLTRMPGRPDRLVIGVESGGVHLSDDGGETWVDRREGGPDDIHQVLPLASEAFIVATGFLDLDPGASSGTTRGDGGVYRTEDLGETWTRLDEGHEHAYVRQVHREGDRLFVCGSRTPPPEWPDGGTDAALFESPDLGETFERVPYPGEPGELIEAWAEHGGSLLAGTGAFSAHVGGTVSGRVIQRVGAGQYRTLGQLPANIGSLEGVE